jgi:DNA-directed RNA polymerase subunit RPC12/RpoP
VIIRTYLCEECGKEFEVTFDSSEEPDPDCPSCSKVLQWVPGLFSVKTDRSRAVDYTQKMVEQDYGLTNLNDGSREGDVAYKAPSAPQTSERENIERAVREYVAQTTAPVAIPQPPGAAPVTQSVWGAQPAVTMQTQAVPSSAMLAGARQGPGSEVNAMELLQKGIKSGQIPRKERIVAKWSP